jgi:hypothetical protein
MNNEPSTPARVVFGCKTSGLTAKQGARLSGRWLRLSSKNSIPLGWPVAILALCLICDPHYWGLAPNMRAIVTSLGLFYTDQNERAMLMSR